MLKMLSSYLLDGSSVVNPIYSGLSLVGPYAIGVVMALCLFYGVFLGVKYAKATEEDEKANAQKTLINFIIGAIVVLVLLCVLYAIREPLANFISG